MKRSVSLIAAALVACVASMLAVAAGTTSTVSWVAPTTYTNGAAVAASDIASYTVSWSGSVSGTMTVTAPALTATVPVACGSVSFTVSVTTSATSPFPGVTSAASSPAVPYSSGVTCTINPPTGVQAK